MNHKSHPISTVPANAKARKSDHNLSRPSKCHIPALCSTAASASIVGTPTVTSSSIYCNPFEFWFIFARNTEHLYWGGGAWGDTRISLKGLSKYKFENRFIDSMFKICTCISSFYKEGQYMNWLEIPLIRCFTWMTAQRPYHFLCH